MNSNASALLCGSTTSAVCDAIVGDIGTLGGGIMGVDVGTLGDIASGLTIVVFVGVIDSVLYNCVASSRSALRTGSPAFNDGVVDDGESVKREMISSAACLR